MSDDPFVVLAMDVGAATHDYRSVWETQRNLHRQVVEGSRPPTVLILEHSEVFTAGSRTQPEDRPQDGSEVVEVDRGGRITWHGPGQLVCYPIVPLPHPMDVVAHVRRLEEIAIKTCADFEVEAQRVEGRSGAWVFGGTEVPAKIAAVGVRVSRGVSMHGLALNVSCDLSWAERIIPCGLTGTAVTSISEINASGVDVGEVSRRLVTHLQAVLSPALPASRNFRGRTLDK